MVLIQSRLWPSTLSFRYFIESGLQVWSVVDQANDSRTKTVVIKSNYALLGVFDNPKVNQQGLVNLNGIPDL